MAVNSENVVSNLFWRLLERFGAQGVSFVVSLVLARLLNPSVYGTIALVTVFITFLNVFVDSGMANALIQKKEVDDLDYSSVFYFNLIICIILYLLLFFAAPIIASFYDQPELIPLIRVLSIILIISGIKNVQQAYVSRNMLFKRFFFATLGGTLGAAIIGIWMALRGFGIWALVAQYLFNSTLDLIILWVTVRWRPKLLFSFNRLKVLISFGWKLLLSHLLDATYRDLKQLIIGKIYKPSDLAYYNRGAQFPKLIVDNINTSIDSVLLPSMSSVQDNKMKVRDMTRRAIKTSSYLMMPMMMGLAICAEPIVKIILTEKWLNCVFFLRVFCFTYAFYPIHTANLNAIKAMGRSDIFLKLEIIKKIIGLTLTILTMFISVKAMALSGILTSILSQLINSWPNKELLEYSYRNQLLDMMPQIGLSCLMGLVVFCVKFIGLSDWLTLLVQVPLGAIIYIVGSKLFHIDSFEYIIGVLRKREKVS